ncbi:NAD(P)-dependent oxidoreductase [Bacteroidota bacterium]
MKIGILRETKNPPDKRVPLTPEQCKSITEKHPGLEIQIQASEYRCYSDKEYASAGIKLEEQLDTCDLLLGVKEVNIPDLIPGKTYLFFSHTAKKQPYNRGLLQVIMEKGITLIDYEYLTRQDGTRVVAFGRWAGIVGAYNGLKAYGMRQGLFELPPANDLHGLPEMKDRLKEIKLDTPRIILTGGGRVASGAMEILKASGIKEISPVEYLSGKNEDCAVFCRLDPWHYTRHIHNLDFKFAYFVEHPEEYENTFLPYAEMADIYIACHFWDPRAPVLLGRDDLKQFSKHLKVIADISCDINGPIASTIRASSIAEPLYGYDPETGTEIQDPFEDKSITVMAVDNLPGELPRDASEDFGNALIEHVIPAFQENDENGVIERATIVRKGKFTEEFRYLQDFVEGE